MAFPDEKSLDRAHKQLLELDPNAVNPTLAFKSPADFLATVKLKSYTVDTEPATTLIAAQADTLLTEAHQGQPNNFSGMDFNQAAVVNGGDVSVTLPAQEAVAASIVPSDPSAGAGSIPSASKQLTLWEGFSVPLPSFSAITGFTPTSSIPIGLTGNVQVDQVLGDIKSALENTATAMNLLFGGKASNTGVWANSPSARFVLNGTELKNGMITNYAENYSNPSKVFFDMSYSGGKASSKTEGPGLLTLSTHNDSLSEGKVTGYANKRFSGNGDVAGTVLVDSSGKQEVIVKPTSLKKDNYYSKSNNVDNALASAVTVVEATPENPVAYFSTFAYSSKDAYYSSVSNFLGTLTVVENNKVVTKNPIVKVYSSNEYKTPEESFRESLTRTSDNRNEAIYLMRMSGPDAMKNMFDVIISFEGGDGAGNPVSSLVFDGDSTIEKNILAADVFAVRVASIAIPQPESQTYNMAFLEREITKIKSKVSMKFLSHFSVDLDQNLYFIDRFQKLAGRYTTVTSNWKNDTASQPAATIRPSYGDKVKANKYLFNLLTKTWLNQRIYNDGSKRMVNMYVHLRNLAPFVAGPFQYTNDDMPYFKFEDVRFLGSGDDLTFERDDAAKMTVSQKFIYRRCYKVHSPSKSYQTALSDSSASHGLVPPDLPTSASSGGGQGEPIA